MNAADKPATGWKKNLVRKVKLKKKPTATYFDYYCCYRPLTKAYPPDMHDNWYRFSPVCKFHRQTNHPIHLCNFQCYAIHPSKSTLSTTAESQPNVSISLPINAILHIHPYTCMMPWQIFSFFFDWKHSSVILLMYVEWMAMISVKFLALSICAFNSWLMKWSTVVMKWLRSDCSEYISQFRSNANRRNDKSAKFGSPYTIFFLRCAGNRRFSNVHMPHFIFSRNRKTEIERTTKINEWVYDPLNLNA